MSDAVAAIVNPNAGGGRTRKRWSDIKRKLETALEREVRAYVTERPGHAAALARRALDDGASLVLAVGGDGTLNECVNGFLTSDDVAYRPDVALGLAPSGTGGDFRRTLGVPDGLDEAIVALASAAPRPIDVGRLSFVDDAGEETQRAFVNIASFGLSGAVDRRVNSATWSKWFGGGFAYKFETLMAVLGWKDQMVRLVFDDGATRETAISTVAVANGRYFGSGMMIAPDAEPDDGLFDVVVVEGAGKGALMKDADAVYEGRHLENPLVSVRRTRTLVAEPADASGPVLLDVDGEAPGRLPARFEVLPAAITILA